MSDWRFQILKEFNVIGSRKIMGRKWYCSFGVRHFTPRSLGLDNGSRRTELARTSCHFPRRCLALPLKHIEMTEDL